MYYSPLRGIILIAALTLSLSFSQSRVEQLQRMIDSVSVQHLTTHIDMLQRAGGHWSRANFTPGNDSAVVYVQKKFKKISGLTSVHLDTFYVPSALPPYDTKPMFNVVATLRGTKHPDNTVVIGAHIDACGSRMPEWNQQWNTMRVPGADDNASGVAVILELARILSDTLFGYVNDNTFVFIAFGVEETGPAYTGYTYGSKHYAQQAKARGENIIAMVSVDMVGFNDNNLYLNIVTDNASQWISKHITAMNDTFRIGTIVSEAPFAYTWSDHASFWNYGFPAVCLIECAPPTISNQYYTANPYFHTTSDSLALLNMDLVRTSARLTLASFATISSLQTSIKQKTDTSPFEFVLEQNYPNPFNPTTTIVYTIPARRVESSTVKRHNYVSLRVYNLLGQEVAIVVNELKEPGSHAVQFDASHLPSGIYIYRLQAGNIVQVKKMTMIR